ncbi:TetR/AcrR family transcriptional regulator [Nakamurella sp. PAMC28650]|uniref:TetR/AcrR family transcriptional regulator n=1 Tax=Nakamurella sp. PAMC28650 TaxID=2762325 RepID=UPI00164D04B0|nr:TetR/AcrR family transcriptional regulator [Nakamurella sp. PAMC28650]QNK81633.1 TetR family transcriptional regulator [Nakamurella sp. PAMC28650]
MSPTIGLRESKKVGTRAALVRCALELAEERGYDGFTIADLVEMAGVSRRTFSNYFNGKAECLAAVSESWIDAAVKMISDAPAEVPLTDLLRGVLDHVAEQIAGSRLAFMVMVESVPELAAAMNTCDVAHGEKIAAIISARTGIGSDDLRVPLLAEFCLAAGRTCTQRWLARGAAGEKASLARDLDAAFSLIDFAGLLDLRKN